MPHPPFRVSLHPRASRPRSQDTARPCSPSPLQIQHGLPEPVPRNDVGSALASTTQAAQELSENPTRTREQRLAFAQRVRLLLLADAMRLAPSGSWFSRPEVARRPDDFFSALRADHTQRLRELRYRSLRQAAEYRLGADANNWLRDASRGPDRICELALASEEGLEAALQDLASMSSPDR